MRQIVLNLVREHQPISRADLARRMHVSRGLITQIVDELIAVDLERDAQGWITGEIAGVPSMRDGKVVAHTDIGVSRDADEAHQCTPPPSTTTH